MSEFNTNVYVPYSELKKFQGKVELEFKALFQNKNSPEIVAMTNQMALILLRQLIIADPSSIQTALQLERAGNAPNVEGRLRQVLAMDGMNINSDVLYGKSIPEPVLRRWEELGMNPDAEDNVREFLERNNVSQLPRSKIDVLAHKLEDLAKKHTPLIEKTLQVSEKIKPTGPKI